MGRPYKGWDGQRPLDQLLSRPTQLNPVGLVASVFTFMTPRFALVRIKTSPPAFDNEQIHSKVARISLGLGLSIVKHIVELHGGTVRADIAGAGCGATFTVDLPVRAVHSEPPDNRLSDLFHDAPAPAEVSVRLDELRVLVVDDEVDARRVLSRVVSEAGAMVTSVGSVDEALLALRAVHPHVLLSDLPCRIRMATT